MPIASKYRRKGSRKKREQIKTGAYSGICPRENLNIFYALGGGSAPIRVQILLETKDFTDPWGEGGVSAPIAPPEYAFGCKLNLLNFPGRSAVAAAVALVPSILIKYRSNNKKR